MNLIICISIVFDEKNMSQKPSKRLGVFHSKSMLPDGQSASRMIARRADRPFVTSSLPEHFHSTGCPTGNQSFEIVFPKILAANYFKLIWFTFKIFAEAIFSFGILPDGQSAIRMVASFEFCIWIRNSKFILHMNSFRARHPLRGTLWFQNRHAFKY